MLMRIVAITSITTLLCFRVLAEPAQPPELPPPLKLPTQMPHISKVNNTWHYKCPGTFNSTVCVVQCNGIVMTNVGQVYVVQGSVTVGNQEIPVLTFVGQYWTLHRLNAGENIQRFYPKSRCGMSVDLDFRCLPKPEPFTFCAHSLRVIKVNISTHVKACTIERCTHASHERKLIRQASEARHAFCLRAMQRGYPKVCLSRPPSTCFAKIIWKTSHWKKYLW